MIQVEGGRIDHALHNNNAKKALEETLQFDLAIEAALKVSIIEYLFMRFTIKPHSNIGLWSIFCYNPNIALFELSKV